MKNNILIISFILILTNNLFANDLLIEAKDISLNKANETTVFKNDVVIKTKDKIIRSEFAEYNKSTQTIILKENVIAKDNQQNTIKTDYAEFDESKNVFKTLGITTLISSKDYVLEGYDLYFDNKNGIIKSDKNSTLKDLSGNIIIFENFEYLVKQSIFKSIGLIKIEDQFSNDYKCSQKYIDTKKKEIIGTDIKAFLNNEDFKINSKNNPRIFANTMKSSDEMTSFGKSVFTICEFREGEKCPPWTLQSKKMTHDKKSKTIFYDNAVLKVYNIPIFYFPYISHPDPTVDRRSGFLPPSFSDTKNLGASIKIPYFWALADDKNFTITNRLFVDEHPLLTGEYNQAFKNSNFLADFGYTGGYKNTSQTKKAGEKSHFFSKFIKNFKNQDGSESTLNIITQNVSNKKYLKLYKIESNLVDYNVNNLENSINFTHSKNDTFFGINTSVYQTLKNQYNDKYEYVFPEITFDKNILSSEKFGNFDLQSNYKAHNYDTNKLTNFLVNDLSWESNDFIINSKIRNKILGKFKNINYEAKNVDLYKDDTTSELFGALGLYSEINLQKKDKNILQTLTPKFLLKLSPGSMRKENEGSRLTSTKAFNLDRSENINNFETGNTATLGFEYNYKKNDLDKFNFSVSQIINEKENKKLHSKSSLDEKLSDLVGEASFNINKNVTLNHQFAIDQNYEEFNYNDLNANINLENFNMDFNYIEENKHLGDQEYFKTKLSYKNNSNNLVSLETKRNLITNSSVFYNLSYEYINDCLRAGLVFRREFYNDSELESDNSLMFNITLVPFGNIDTPKINR